MDVSPAKKEQLQAMLDALLEAAKAGQRDTIYLGCPACHEQIDLADFGDDGSAVCGLGHRIHVDKDELRAVVMAG